eukprot:1066489-Prymnesium_polylepis.3
MPQSLDERLVQGCIVAGERDCREEALKHERAQRGVALQARLTIPPSIGAQCVAPQPKGALASYAKTVRLHHEAARVSLGRKEDDHTCTRRQQVAQRHGVVARATRNLDVSQHADANLCKRLSERGRCAFAILPR